MTTVLEPPPLVDAAARYRHAVARIDDATGDAATAWRLLPHALDAPGADVAVARFVAPAHRLSSELLGAADALVGALLTPGPAASWSIAGIRGGEPGSVALPDPDPPRALDRGPRTATFITPPLPLGGALSQLGGLADAGAAAGAATVAGLLGVLGLVLSLGGSTDVSPPQPTLQPPPDRRRPRPGSDPVRITPYTPCNPLTHGPGCQLRHLGLEEPGDRAFTGDAVRGDEPPGEMPGTQPDWVRGRARNDEGWVYTSPEGKSVRIVEAGRDPRYPNGYVVFRNARNQPIGMDGTTTVPLRSDAAHVVRNPDGSFPVPTGWAP
ncbi:MAG TPA: hypothetical protein VGC45_16450 [Gryllotalpicola sp.]